MAVVKKFPQPPRFSLRWITTGLLVVGALFFVWTGFYTVPAESEGVILRFGRFSHVAPSGLHFKLPLGIDSSEIVPVKRQLKVEFGFGTENATAPFQAGPASEFAEVKAMVTGDLNAAVVEWVIQYRIERADHYLFNVRNPDETLRDVSESVMREVVGDRTVDEVITIGRQEVEDEALQKLRTVVNSYHMGLKVDQVQLKNVNPPEKVQASFNEVNAAQTIRAAEGYAKQRVNEAEGEVAAFNALLAEYSKAPEVTRRRLYLETMADVLPKVKNKVIVSDDVKGMLPLLNLNALSGAGKAP
jgi:membrane protease subunit HflK